jgi:hypothetical protein
MKPPTFEVADIIRSASDRFIERNQSHLNGKHSKCYRPSITAAQQRSAVVPNQRPQPVARRSHRGVARRQLFSCGLHPASGTVRARTAEQAAIYNPLLQASAATVHEVAGDPKTSPCGDRFPHRAPHLEGQNLQAHPHVHCVAPVGSLSRDDSRWVVKYPFWLP